MFLYLYKLPLPGLKDGFGFIFIPVYVMDLIVVLKVFIQLLRTHQQEHSLESLRTAKYRSFKFRTSQTALVYLDYMIYC